MRQLETEVNAQTEPAAASAEVTGHTEPAAATGKLTRLEVPELQARYLEVVGRPTGSTNKPYMIWKIREAQKGRSTRNHNAAATADEPVHPARCDHRKFTLATTDRARWCPVRGNPG